MVNEQYCKLIMVTSANNNKFYEMVCEDSKTIKIKYGRIDHTETNITAPYGKWKGLKAAKIKKGYKDVTDLVSVEVKEVKKKPSPEVSDIADKRVKAFIDLMLAYTNNLVVKTYSVKSTSVSQKQLDKAQKLIDEITEMDKTNPQLVNDKLIELYTVIPRYISHISRYILPNIDLDKALIQEQDNLDAMTSQVKMNQPDEIEEENVQPKQQSILDVIGITMKELPKPTTELEYLIKQVTGTRSRIDCVYEVNKKSEDKTFEEWLLNAKNKTTKILIHGTRCTSVIPILKEGLKIRPVGNFQFSGKAYGDGNYFSEVIQKSLGYTGYDSDKILLVYEVHTGNPFTYDGWYRGNSFTLNYKNLSERGYDSTYVKAGNGMLNSEIIAYSEKQNRIKYIIHLK
jgi:poly [ADP-ribose] polymerase